MFFCTLSLIIRIFTNIYDILQYCYENWRSPESWSPSLMSPPAENNGEENPINARFKRHETRRMFSGVLSCTDTKTRSPTQIYTRKRLFVCFIKQLKEPLLGYISVFSFGFYCRYMRGHQKHLASVTSLLLSFLPFFLLSFLSSLLLLSSLTESIYAALVQKTYHFQLLRHQSP